jgi:hypothetical protein
MLVSGACRAREKAQREDMPAESPLATPDVVNLVNWLRAEEELGREMENRE